MRPYHQFGVPFNNQFEYGPNESGPAFQAPFQAPFHVPFQGPIPGSFPEGPNWQFGPPPPRGLLAPPYQFYGPETSGPGFGQTERFHPYNKLHRKSIVCKFHKRGFCRLGDECDFLHDLKEIKLEKEVSEASDSVTNNALTGVDETVDEIATPATSSAINNNGDNLPMNYTKIDTKFVQGKSSSASIRDKAIKETKPTISKKSSAKLKSDGTSEKLSKDNLEQKSKKEKTEPSWKKQVVCRYHKKGNCKLKEKCEFLHQLKEKKAPSYHSKDARTGAERTFTEIATTATSSVTTKKKNLLMRHPEIDKAANGQSSSVKNLITEGTKPSISKESSAYLKANGTHEIMNEGGLSNELIVDIKRERQDFDLDDQLAMRQEKIEETVERIKTEEELPHIFARDVDLRVFDIENDIDEAGKNQAERELERKKKCDYCYSKVPGHLIIFKNDRIFIFIKDQKPMMSGEVVCGEFIIRGNPHIPSLMSGQAQFLREIVNYKRELCSIFALENIKLIFVEYFDPDLSLREEKEHFDILVFPIREKFFKKLREFFLKGINKMKEHVEITFNFNDLGHFERIQEQVPKQKGYISITFQEEGFLSVKTSEFFPNFAESTITQLLGLDPKLYSKPKLEYLNETVARAGALRQMLEGFIHRHS